MNEMAVRHAYLAKRPKCQKVWYPPTWSFPFVDKHYHRCARFRDHANRECRCNCGATRTRNVGKR